MSLSKPRYRLPIFILLLAVLVRVHALGRDVRFISDEAFYATFARSAVVDGNWLFSGELDKPPLSLYMGAAAMRLWGVVYDDTRGVWDIDPLTGEFAVRMANVFTSILQVAVMFPLMKTLYAAKSKKLTAEAPSTSGTGKEKSPTQPLKSAKRGSHQRFMSAARLASLPFAHVSFAPFLMALSPFGIAFAPTAFTDNLMLLCMTLALLCAARGRGLASGAWLAAGFASKPQAILYLPLILMIAWALDRLTWRMMRRFIVAFSIGFALLLLWDALRTKPGTIWALAAPRTNPGRLIRSNEVLPHLLKYLDFAGWMFGYPLLTALLALTASAAAAVRMQRQRDALTAVIDVLLLAYLFGYVFFHWLVAFPVYDRYLLPLLPILALLVARGIDWALNGLFFHLKSAAFSRAFLWLVLGGSVGILLFLGAWSVGDGAVPIGGDQGANAGINDLAAYLNAKPFGTIYYNYWLGFELDYYMGYWTDKRRVYYPAPHVLVEDALRNADPLPRYFVAPTSVSVERWLEAMQQAGFGVRLDYESVNFVVYELHLP